MQSTPHYPLPTAHKQEQAFTAKTQHHNSQKHTPEHCPSATCGMRLARRSAKRALQRGHISTARKTQRVQIEV
jgi:hypothetical protein